MCRTDNLTPGTLVVKDNKAGYTLLRIVDQHRRVLDFHGHVATGSDRGWRPATTADVADYVHHHCVLTAELLTRLVKQVYECG